MAGDAKQPPPTNGTQPPNKAIELAIGLPHNPGTRVHLRLDISPSSILLFLTSASIDAGQGNTPLGSFVYAMPDVSTSPNRSPPRGSDANDDPTAVQPNSTHEHIPLHRPDIP